MYDMYPWDDRADGARTPAPRNGNAPETGPATAAVQVALDRRDNGGEVNSEMDGAEMDGAEMDGAEAATASGRK